MLRPAPGQQQRVIPLGGAVDDRGHRARASPAAAASRIARSIGVSCPAGIGTRPVSQSASNTSGNSINASIPSSSSGPNRSSRAATNPPISRSFS